MHETKDKTQGQKPRISGFAEASLGAGVVGLFTFMFPVLLMVLPVAGLVLGLLALMQARISKKSLEGHSFAIAGIILSIIGLVPVVMYYAVPRHNGLHELARQVGCATHLKMLGGAMIVYVKDNDYKYPTADKWCDLLVHGGYVNEEEFRCPGNKVESCSYAINLNAQPNSPNDVVLLFETEGGWNQFGGPELLATENHKGKGCNILFNDGNVEFVKSSELNKLKWKTECTSEIPTSELDEKDIYIPKDLDDCFAELEKILKPEDIKKMKEGTENDIIQYHFGLGMWIRNNWGLWGESHLAKWFNAQGIKHPDDMSSIILNSFWRHLNSKPIKLNEQVKYYQDYWKKMEVK